MVDVSVVIPTHNRRHLLAAALRSVQRQRDVELEIVVVDDGSTDGTELAVAEARDPRIRLIRSDRSRGVGTARNEGLRVGTGAWIAFLDDDDLWAPTKLAGQLTAAQRDAAVWVYAGVVEIAGDGRLLGGARPPRPPELVAGLLRRNLVPAGCSNVLVRADVLHEVGGFDRGLRHLGDWDLWLRLARRFLPAVAPAPLVAYRQHAGQATLDTTGMVAEARILAARHGADPVSIHRWAAWSFLRTGRRRAAVAAYLNAIAAGDLSSIGRAAVAALHPHPTGLRRPGVTPPDPEWLREAQDWLDELAAVLATALEDRHSRGSVDDDA
jgi:glycosyltransferase involved in cell wall biosynthesis